GQARYHHRHPFHLLMHEGKLSRGQLQAWALNRYYYQSVIPIKDAIILSRSDDPEFRRAWRKRIVDHDGDSNSDSHPDSNTKDGGIKHWLKLAEAVGSERISKYCADAAAAGSGGFIANRTLFPRSNHVANGSDARALPVAHR